MNSSDTSQNGAARHIFRMPYDVVGSFLLSFDLVFPTNSGEDFTYQPSQPSIVGQVDSEDVHRVS